MSIPISSALRGMIGTEKATVFEGKWAVHQRIELTARDKATKKQKVLPIG